MDYVSLIMVVLTLLFCSRVLLGENYFSLSTWYLRQHSSSWSRQGNSGSSCLQQSSSLEVQGMVGYLFFQQGVSARSQGREGRSLFQQELSFLSQFILSSIMCFQRSMSTALVPLFYKFLLSSIFIISLPNIYIFIIQAFFTSI